MERQYNTRSPAVKRLMREAKELCEATNDYHAKPLEDNLFEWHFTVRGPPDTAFDGGIYHGRIILPPEYPMKPPHIIILTPNGRFEVGVKICLSISGHHPESWQPSWSIRTAILAIIGFMPNSAQGIGSLDYGPEERKRLAKKSANFECETCGKISLLLKNEKTKESDGKEGGKDKEEDTTMKEANEIIKKMSLNSAEEEKKTVEKSHRNQDKEKDKDKELKRASKAVAERYRKRLMERTAKLRNNFSALPQQKVTSSPSSSVPNSNTTRQPEANNSGINWLDILVIAIVATIACIIYRRLG